MEPGTQQEHRLEPAAALLIFSGISISISYQISETSKSLKNKYFEENKLP